MKRMLISIVALTLAVFMFAGLAQPVFADGAAPVAENLELKTYRNVSVGGSLAAYDPDGETLSFEITTNPVKGSVELSGDGSFIYTPMENKRGRDYFGYKALDGEGNYSQEATVIIKIEKQKKDVFYSDLKGRPEEYSAVALSENGIFTGEQLGGHYCFFPERAVTRGEFLSMCVILSGEPVLSGVMSTGYADDESIPSWMKSYVATAAMCGVEAAYSTENGCVFDAFAPISRVEAAQMLNKALNVTTVSYVQLSKEMDHELAQACANLKACGLIGESCLIDDTLSRAEAARMICAAMELQARR